MNYFLLKPKKKTLIRHTNQNPRDLRNKQKALNPVENQQFENDRRRKQTQVKGETTEDADLSKKPRYGGRWLRTPCTCDRDKQWNLPFIYFYY